MKKRWLMLVLLVGLTILFDQRMRPSELALQPEAYDPFTNPAVIKKQQYMETELARGLVSLAPTAPGHCLIIPKRAVLRFEELTCEEVVEMSYVIRHTHEAIQTKLGPCDYVLLQKNGACVGQASNHLIWHYVPRPHVQPSVLLFTLRFAHPFHSRLNDEKMFEWVDSLKKALYEEHELSSVVITASDECKFSGCKSNFQGCAEIGDEVAPVPAGSRAMNY